MQRPPAAMECGLGGEPLALMMVIRDGVEIGWADIDYRECQHGLASLYGFSTPHGNQQCIKIKKITD